MDRGKYKVELGLLSWRCLLPVTTVKWLGVNVHTEDLDFRVDLTLTLESCSDELMTYDVFGIKVTDATFVTWTPWHVYTSVVSSVSFSSTASIRRRPLPAFPHLVMVS